MRWIILILIVLMAKAKKAKLKLDGDLFWKQFMSINSIKTAYDNPLNLTTSSLELNRIERNGEHAFTILQNRIGALARVVSGVTLFNGLVDGSIPVDEAMCDLMFMEPFSLTDLEKFEKKHMDGFIQKLKDANGKLSVEGANMESHIADLHRMREMWNGVGDLDKLPGQAQFDNLKSLVNLDLTALEAASTFNFAAAFDGDDEATITAAKDNLKAVATSLETILKTIKEKSIVEIVESIGPMYKYALVRDVYDESESASIKTADNIDQVISDFKYLETVSREAYPFIRIFDSIVYSRTVGFNRQYGNGFVDVNQNLAKLLNDIKDDWILKVIGPSVSLDKLATLANLAGPLENFYYKKMIPMVYVERTVQKADAIEQRVGTFKGASETVKSIVEVLKTLDFNPKTKDHTANLIKTSMVFRKFFKRIRGIEAMSELMKASSEHINTLSASDSKAKTKCEKLIGNLEPIIKMMTTAPTVKELIRDIISSSKLVIDFQTTSTNQKFIQFFDSLKALNVDTQMIAEAAKQAIQIREVNIDPEFFKDLEKTGTAMSEEPRLFKPFRSVIDDIKNTPIESMESFSKLKNLARYSKPLGDVSFTVEMIRYMMFYHYKLQDFYTRHSENAELYLQKLFDQQNMTNKWLAFEDDFKRLAILFAKGERLHDDVLLPKEDELQNYAPILEGLTGLGSVRLEIEKKWQLVEVLRETLTDDSQKILSEDVSSMTFRSGPWADLEFTRFDAALSSISQTFAGIKKVFDSTLPTTTGEPTVVPSTVANTKIVQELKPLAKVTESSTTTQEPGFLEKNWILLLIGSIVVLLLVGAGSYFAYWCKKHKTNKNANSGKSSNTQSGETTDPEKNPRKKSKSAEGSKSGR